MMVRSAYDDGLILAVVSLLLGDSKCVCSSTTKAVQFG